MELKNLRQKKLDESHRLPRNKLENEIFLISFESRCFLRVLHGWRIEVESFAMHVAVDRTVLIHAEEAACHPCIELQRLHIATAVAANVIDMEVQKCWW